MEVRTTATVTMDALGTGGIVMERIELRALHGAGGGEIRVYQNCTDNSRLNTLVV